MARLGKGKGLLLIGLMNGLMPCGPLQAMQLCALSAGSWWMGGLSMLAFALGTTPLMLGFGLVGGRPASPPQAREFPSGCSASTLETAD